MKRTRPSKSVERLKPRAAERVWGVERLMIHTPQFTLKMLVRKAGTQGPLQMHREKDEATYLLSGRAVIWYDRGDGKLRKMKVKAGDAYRFPPGSVHREDAITDCVFIEVSNPVFNDRVRLEEHYGIEPPEPYGLPTSLVKDIVFTNSWKKVRGFKFR